MIRSNSVAVSAALALFGMIPSTALADEIGIFRDAGNIPGISAKSASPERYVRSRLVHLDAKNVLELLELHSNRASSPLRLNLFNEIIVDAHNIQKNRTTNPEHNFDYYTGVAKDGGDIQVIVGEDGLDFYIDILIGNFVVNKLEGDLYMVAQEKPFDRKIPDHDSDENPLPPYPQDIIDKYNKPFDNRTQSD